MDRREAKRMACRAAVDVLDTELHGDTGWACTDDEGRELHGDDLRRYRSAVEDLIQELARRGGR